MFGDFITKVKYHVVNESTVECTIRTPQAQGLKAKMDLYDQWFGYTAGRKSLPVTPEPDHGLYKPTKSKSDNKHFHKSLRRKLEDVSSCIQLKRRDVRTFSRK